MTAPIPSEQHLSGPAEDVSPQPIPAVPPRSILIDVVRGLAICLVVLGHTEQGVDHRGWWHGSSIGLRLNYAIYAFHMPAFFFISGVFLRTSVKRHGVWQVVSDKLRGMIWPYVVFSSVSALAIIFFGRFMLQATESPLAFLIALCTGTANWFLPTLFFTIVLGVCGRKLPSWLFLLIAIAVSTWYPWTHIAFMTRSLKFLPFLVLGMWVERAYERIERVPVWIAFAGSLAMAFFLVWITRTIHTDTTPWYLPLGVLGTLMLLLIARIIGRGSLARTLSWVGAASFGIMLLAPYPQGAGRALLLRLSGITNPYAQTIGPTILAVLLPALLFRFRLRLRLGWMFVFPW